MGLRPVTAAGAPILDAPCVVVHRDALEAGQKPALAMSDKQLVKGIDKTKAGVTLINLASEEQARHNASRQTKSGVVSQRSKNEPER